MLWLDHSIGLSIECGVAVLYVWWLDYNNDCGFYLVHYICMEIEGTKPTTPVVKHVMTLLIASMYLLSITTVGFCYI
jgi:hypothetical protein